MKLHIVIIMLILIGCTTPMQKQKVTEEYIKSQKELMWSVHQNGWLTGYFAGVQAMNSGKYLDSKGVLKLYKKDSLNLIKLLNKK